MKKIFTVAFILSAFVAQAQGWQDADTIQCPAGIENIYSRPLYSDSLSSSFVIFIKKEVKLHKHLAHTEHVMVLDGEGTMTMGYKTFTVKKGDLIFIPVDTPHKVVTTSKQPLKVISLQSPFFDGKDRVLLE